MTHPHIRVGLVACLAAVLVLGATAAFAAPQPEGPPAEKYDLADLQSGGTVVDERFPSVRKVSETAALWLKEYDASLFSSYGDGGTFLSSGDRIERNQIRLYSSSAFDGESDVYEVEIVYWVPDTKTSTTNGTTTETRVAKILGSDEQRVSMSPGFQQFADLDLTGHFDQTVRMTAFAYDADGELVAKWGPYRHHSIPSQAPIDMNSWGDVWEYVVIHVLSWGAGSIVIGFAGAKWTLSRTGTGPRVGWIVWGIAVLILATVLGSALAYQVAVVLRNLPQLLGLVMGLIAYAGALQMHDPLKTLGFYRPRIEETAPLRREDLERKRDQLLDRAGSGEAAADGGMADGDERIKADEWHDARLADLVELPFITTREGETRIPKRGLRPWLARMWADPASPDKSDLQTPQYVEAGEIDELVTVDPQFEETVIHTPARLSFDPPLMSRGPYSDDEGLLTTLKRVNWSFLLGSGLALALGWSVGNAMDFGIGGVGLGALAIIIYSVRAKDGTLEFVPAPEHFRKALVSNTILQRERKDAVTVEDALEEAAAERTRTATEARDQQAREDTTVTRELARKQAPILDDVETRPPAEDHADRRTDVEEGGDDGDE